MQSDETDVSQFDTRFTRQTPVDSPDDSTLSESADRVFAVRFTGTILVSCSHWHNTTTPVEQTVSGATQQGETSLDFTEVRDSGLQWHHLDHMPVCTSLQTDHDAITPPLSFLQAGCPSCCQTNSVKALKAASS